MKNSINIPKTTLTFGGSSFNIYGDIDNTKDSNFSYNVNFDGKFSSSAIYEVVKQYEKFKNYKASALGEIEANGKISGKGLNGNIKSEIHADKDNYLSYIVIKELLNQPSVTNIDISIKDNEVLIKDFSLNKKNEKSILDKIVILNGRIKNVKTSVLENIKISIPKSMTFSVSQLKNSEITIQSDVILNGNINEPQIQGSLDIKNIDIPEYKIKSVENNIVFEKNNMKIYIPNFEIGKSKINIAGNLSSKFAKTIVLKDLILKSDLIDLDEINEIFADMANDAVYPGIKMPITIPVGKAEFKQFLTGGLQAENITCDIAISNNILKMSHIAGTAYKGQLTGNAEYSFLQTSTKSELTGKNADMKVLIKALTGRDDEISGLIDYKVKLNSIGTKRIQQQRTAKGFVEFTAMNGIMGPLGQFEHFLYAQNLISQSLLKTTVLNVIKAVKPQNTGMYSIAKGKMEISGGNAYLKPITVEGPNMSLYITGKWNILNDVADIKIYGRISQKVESILGELANPMPKMIMSKSSETSIGNLFYEDYNTTIPKSILDAIPQLNPDTGISSRPFMVVIQGLPDSIKAVKSFKWIVSEEKAPLAKDYNRTRNETETKTNIQITPEKEIDNKNNKEKDKKLPLFLDNLPDEFN